MRVDCSLSVTHQEMPVGYGWPSAMIRIPDTGEEFVLSAVFTPRQNETRHMACAS